MAGTMNNSGGGRNNGPKSGSNTKARQGGANSGGKPSTQFSADQRKLLQKIRAVIPKDRASDEELMTMLVDQNMDTDRVVQQFFEPGNTESEWASVTNKRDSRKKKTELQTDTKHDTKARPANGQQNGQANGQANGQQRQAGARQQAQPARPAAAPAPHRPAPANDGNSWAARLRGPQTAAPAPPEPRAPQPLPMPQDMPTPGMNGSAQQTPNMLQFGSFDSNQFGLAPEPQFPPPQQGFMPPAAAQKQGPFPEASVTSTTGRHGDVLHSQTQQRNIWQSLVELWDKRELCDLKLKPEPGETRISVHSVVIAAASSTVSQALINSRRDSNSNVTPPELLVHCDCVALEECVRFCYTGELRVSDEAIQNLWYAASVLELREVLDLCVSWAQQHIHAGNALLINQLADLYQIPDLKAAVDRFVLNNVQSLVQEADFLQQPLERITELLSSDDAKFDCELEVFDAVVRWIEHDKPVRTSHLAHLMNTVVRLPQLDFDELEKVEMNDMVSNDAKAKSLMHDVYRYLAAPTQRRLAMDIPGTRPRTNMLTAH